MPQGITSSDEYPWENAAQISTRVIYPVEKMKQVQSDTTLDHWVGQGRARNVIARRRHQRVDSYEETGAHAIARSNPWSWTGFAVAFLSVIWFTISLPFRLTFWLIALLGRLTGVILGFLLMVVGMALWASPLFIVGIPLFVVGLVLTLRCLE
jgi:hypothetical protein